MRKYLKESLHWIHLALFKPITLEREARGWTNAQALRVYLKVLPVQVTIILAVVGFVGFLSVLAGYRSPWLQILVLAMLLGGMGGAVLLGLSMVVERRAAVVVGEGGLGFLLLLGLLVPLLLLLVGPSFGQLSSDPLANRYYAYLGGLFCAIVGMLAAALPRLTPGARWAFGPGVGLILMLIIGLGMGQISGITTDVNTGLRVTIYVGLAYLFVCLRAFHLVAYAFQLWRSKKAIDPFQFFRNSPVYWDEAIAMPLPFLRDWLVRLARVDQRQGMREIANVARLPYQRRAAQRALVSILIQNLEQADSVGRMASAPMLLQILPSNAELPAGLNDAGRHIGRIAELASDYLTRVTTVGQMNMLEELRSAVESFRDG